MDHLQEHKHQDASADRTVFMFNQLSNLKCHVFNSAACIHPQWLTAPSTITAVQRREPGAAAPGVLQEHRLTGRAGTEPVTLQTEVGRFTTAAHFTEPGPVNTWSGFTAGLHFLILNESKFKHPQNPFIQIRLEKLNR